MSAAEKLKALDAMIHYDRGPAGRPTELRVFNALPQIVAVVEAAEQIAEFMAARCKEGDTEYQVVLLARPALAALEEALP